MTKRNFLFLQGVCSPFFSRLAERLMADGHNVLKVNFNAGDLAYWSGGNSISFRGRPQDLRDFLDALFHRHGISDQVLFGDQRPIHRPAVEHADALGIRTHVFEEGYFRPHWVTLEREGVNGHSLLPRDPEWFWAVGGELGADELVVPFASPFSVRAAHDVAYHVAGLANPLLFPRYRTHSPISAPVEYLGYIRRFSLLRLWKRWDAELIADLLANKAAYYVLPLQLNSDAQIRDHSRFESMAEVIEFVIESFARHALVQSRLVIKNHPLDMGLTGYGKVISRLAKEYDVVGRVDYLESGDLDLLVRHARGLVTVNSTVGSVSLGLNCPTVTLSDPIYNLPGLTFQGVLDDFWQEGEAPNSELFQRFRKVVIHATQVNGGFYCRKGIELAVQNSRAILEGEISPLEALI
ncbi:capsular biosynthesis protein [Ferribacterium limneticum]|nr:capsular biosynthesis protein [Ferribacterium limneticum]